MVLFEIHQRFKGHFFNELRVNELRRDRLEMFCLFFEKKNVANLYAKRLIFSINNGIKYIERY